MVCKYKRKIERVEGTDSSTENAEIYVNHTPNKTREKIKLNRIFFHKQVDTGSEETLIQRKIWEKMHNAKLRKRNLQVKRFDIN